MRDQLMPPEVKRAAHQCREVDYDPDAHGSRCDCGVRFDSLVWISPRGDLFCSEDCAGERAYVDLKEARFCAAEDAADAKREERTP